MALAINMLARRDHARAELAQKLARRSADGSEIERVLDELERLGYLSDARFARGVVTQRAGRYAKRAIVHALQERGVAKEAVVEAVAALAGHDEVADATEVWRHRFGTAPRDEREKGRQVRFLLARGYSAATAFKVLRAAGVNADEDSD